MTSTHRHLPAYSERPVTCTQLSSAEPLRPKSLESSVALFYISNALEDAEREKLVKSILSANPLAAYLCGASAEDLFDQLLLALDAPSDAQPMMTNFSDLPVQGLIEEFFTSTWPPEEREEQWADYKLLVYGEAFEQVCDGAFRFLRARHNGPPA